MGAYTGAVAAGREGKSQGDEETSQSEPSQTLGTYDSANEKMAKHKVSETVEIENMVRYV